MTMVKIYSKEVRSKNAKVRRRNLRKKEETEARA